jgi:hypothetical protein
MVCCALAIGLAGMANASVAQALTTPEILIIDNHRASSDGMSTEIATTRQSLTGGAYYVATVRGTVSAWDHSLWSRPGARCGSPQPAPQFSSPGRRDGPVGQDAFFVFGRPTGFDCSRVPYPTGLFETDLGAGFAVVVPRAGLGAAPAVNHTYKLLLPGLGLPVRFRHRDTQTADNYGLFEIEVRPATAADCEGSEECLAAVSSPPPPGAATAGIAGVSETGEAACDNPEGFQWVSTTLRRGQGVRLRYRRRLNLPVRIDIFRVSQGRRVIQERRVARFDRPANDVTWDGRDRRRRVSSDGVYFVRFSMFRGRNRIDVRRVVLRRLNGVFYRRPDHYLRDPCAILRSFKLRRPTFGGSTHRPLRISYLLSRPGRVTVTIRREGRLFRRFQTVNVRAFQAKRLEMSARRIPRGDYRVLVEVVGPSGTIRAALTSRKI